jgi:hypothetical protein
MSAFVLGGAVNPTGAQITFRYDRRPVIDTFIEVWRFDGVTRSFTQLGSTLDPVAHTVTVSTDQLGTFVLAADPTVVGVEPSPVHQALSLRIHGNPLGRKASIEIEYSIPTRSRVRLRVFSVAGALIETLVDQEGDPGGRVVHWDGHNGGGRAVAPGVYFVSLEASGFRRTGRVIILP